MKDSYKDSKKKGMGLVVKELSPSKNLTHKIYNVEERKWLLV